MHSALVICTTCADGQGQALLEAVENEALARDWPLPIRGQACMAACKQSCTAALQGANKTAICSGSSRLMRRASRRCWPWPPSMRSQVTACWPGTAGRTDSRAAWWRDCRRCVDP